MVLAWGGKRVPSLGVPPESGAWLQQQVLSHEAQQEEVGVRDICEECRCWRDTREACACMEVDNACAACPALLDGCHNA
jgi:hypothetical protein